MGLTNEEIEAVRVAWKAGTVTADEANDRWTCLGESSNKG